jgi:guanylate kinase
MSIAKPRLVTVVSGPSGAGKSTLCERFVETHAATTRQIVTTTTRPRRKGEADGVDYDFVTESEFRRGVERGDFLEHAVVHGHLYGSPRRAVEDGLRGGCDVILEIDVQGGIQVKKQIPGALLVFVIPSDLKLLRSRLTGRGTDSAEVIETRLRNAKREMESLADYHCFLFNDDLDSAVATLETIIEAERQRIFRYDVQALFDPKLLESALETA